MMEKVLEELDGFVERIEGDVAYVNLTTKSGEVLWGEYPAPELEAKGIREHRHFKCLTIDIGETVKIELHPIPDMNTWSTI